MRKIYCPECGQVTPTLPEDAARGLFPRRTHGLVLNELHCDVCYKILEKGSPAIAESVPRDMAFWEPEYLKVYPDEQTI
jgi:uncharacterized protein with PIN domain